jgi:hypothetical protein
MQKSKMTNLNKTVNIFSRYSQKENHFTNGIISILSLGNIQDTNFVNDFLNCLLGLETPDDYLYFQVLEGYETKSTADAKLIGKFSSIQFEVKIVTATLRDDQINRHLEVFANDNHRRQVLVLLTPDDSNSKYVHKFLQINDKIIRHLEWKNIYDYLKQYISDKGGVFKSIVEQYLDLIRDSIFEQDIVGIISKVAFGDKSEVYPEKYIEEMRRGLWLQWNTPREYKNLDGTGRKLLLYDKNIKAITVEVEIEKVKQTNEERDYPWSNYFAPGTLVIMDKPIKIDYIQRLAGFEKFAKERAPYRNLTHEQYKQLMKFNRT